MSPFESNTLFRHHGRVGPRSRRGCCGGSASPPPRGRSHEHRVVTAAPPVAPVVPCRARVDPRSNDPGLGRRCPPVNKGVGGRLLLGPLAAPANALEWEVPWLVCHDRPLANARGVRRWVPPGVGAAGASRSFGAVALRVPKYLRRLPRWERPPEVATGSCRT